MIPMFLQRLSGVERATVFYLFCERKLAVNLRLSLSMLNVDPRR